MTTREPARVVVVGVGRVGSTFAFALLRSGLASEIVLVDADRQRAEGEAMDLQHAVPFGPAARVRAGDLADCAGADIVVLTAGAAQGPGETRLDLVRKNAAILQGVVPDVAKHAPEAVLLVATNPVDVLTYATTVWSGVPPARVIGSGTILDTARFRALLGAHYDIDPQSVHAYILGEHGDSEVAAWSLANIAGMRLEPFCAAQGMSCDRAAMDAIFEQTRDAAYRIIDRKGATNLAIAAGLVRLVEAVLRDERSVLTVSSLLDGQHGLHDVCLSLPTVVGGGGIRRVLELDLADGEVAALRRSAEVVRRTLGSIGL